MDSRNMVLQALGSLQIDIASPSTKLACVHYWLSLSVFVCQHDGNVKNKQFFLLSSEECG